MCRAAVVEDFDQAMLLAKAMHAETEFRAFSFSEEKLLELGHRMVDEPNRCFFLVEEDGDVIAMIAGYVASHYFSHDLLAKDQFFYVRKDRRGTRAAVLLMNAFIGWVDGYPEPIAAIVVGVSSGGNNMTAAEKFFAHYGMQRIGGLFRVIRDV